MTTGTIKPYRKLVPECAQEHFVDVQGVRIRYLKAGSGPPIVLVHGLLGFSFSWSETIPVLAQYRTVYALDMANIGYSQRAVVDATLHGHANRLAAFMDALSLPRADFMASSHGGSVVLDFAVLYPQRAGRMLLVSPVNPHSEVERWIVDFMLSSFGKGFAYLLPRTPFAFRKRWMARMYTDVDRAIPGTIEEYTRAAKQLGTMPHILRLLETWFDDAKQLDQRIDELKGRDIHLIWGEHDKLVRLTAGNELSQRLAIPITVIPDCGHLPYEEKPAEFNRIMTELVK